MSTQAVPIDADELAALRRDLALAVALLQEVDKTDLLFKYAMDVDARVANFLSEHV